MDSKEFHRQLKILFALADVTATSAAQKAGMTPQNLNNKISRGSLRAIELYNMADALGYDIVFKKRDNQ